MSNEEKKEPVLLQTGPKSCGCIVAEYDDGTVGIKFCPACGLEETASALNRAAQAISGVARFLKKGHDEQTMAKAVADVAKGPKAAE